MSKLNNKTILIAIGVGIVVFITLFVFNFQQIKLFVDGVIERQNKLYEERAKEKIKIEVIKISNDDNNVYIKLKNVSNDSDSVSVKVKFYKNGELVDDGYDYQDLGINDIYKYSVYTFDEFDTYDAYVKYGVFGDYERIN